MSVDRVGRFGLVGVLGSGGFGTVYEGVDPVSGERVAVKVLDRMGGSADVVRSQLLAEADALRSVVSVNTLRVVDVVDDGGVLALVTDFVVGSSLRSVLDAHGVLSGRDALTVLHGAGLGLAAVHGAGLVHGDVKPANILVGPDGVSKLIDFGLVSLPGWIGEDSASPWGSPAYAPPEHVEHNFRDHRSDIYSLSVTLFEVLCGQRPFGGDTVDEVRSNHVHQVLPDPRVFVPDLGDGLTQLVLWGLAKDPDARPQDVATWLQYLEAAAELKYGAGWASAASVGAIAGAASAGGLLASGVLAGQGATVAGTASAGAGAGAGAAAAAGGASGAVGASGAGAVAGAVKTGLLATGLAKTVAAVAVVATIAAGGIVTRVVVDSRDNTKVVVDSRDKATPEVATPAVKMVEKIAFVRCDGGPKSCAIHTINPDGSDEHEVVEGSSLSEVSWSPDGKKLAYTGQEHGGDNQSQNVFVVNADGTDERRVGTGDYPAWSPDGKKLVYTQCDGSNCNAAPSGTKLVVVDVDGRAEETLDAETGGPATWSPDGTKVAYAQFATGIGGCGFIGFPSFVISVDGSGRTQISPRSSVNEAPQWLPDSQRLLLQEESESKRADSDCGSQTPEPGPHVVSADGSGNKEVGVYGTSLSLSPDGKTVAFTQYESGSIYLTDVRGTNSKKLVDVLDPFALVQWSPSGNQITYSSDLGGDDFAEEIWIVNKDGSGNRLLTSGGYPAWVAVPADVGAGKAPAATGPVSFDPPFELDGTGQVIGNAAKFDALPNDVKDFLRGYATSEFDECGSDKSEPAISVWHYDPEGFVGADSAGSRPDCGTSGAIHIWSKQGGDWRKAIAFNGIPTCDELRSQHIPDSFNSDSFVLTCMEGQNDVDYHR